MVNFEKKIRTKSDQNTPNTPKYSPNCTVLKNFRGGTCPRTPLALMRMAGSDIMAEATCKIPNLKKIILGPPSQILGTPLH